MDSVTRWAIGLLAIAAAASGGEPPWEPSYKIKPEERHRLTAADVVGPDGIVYPDWRYAGVPSGIPDVPDLARIEAFGGKADDDRDDSAAVEKGAQAVAQRGGGALVLGKGTYHLDRPVLITADSVVVRGQGAEATKIVFRYGGPAGGVGFFRPRDGATLGQDDPLEIHASPSGLQRIALEVNGKGVAEAKRSAHWGGNFVLRTLASRLRADAGRRTLKAVAEWKGGKRAETTISVEFDPKRRLAQGRHRFPTASKATVGALMFVGDRRSGATWKLAADGRRGDTEIALASAPDLKPGDAIMVRAPATARWNRLVRNACKWGSYRRYEFRVEAVEGQRVRLNQPLRYDFPTDDGSYAQHVFPIRRCGVEGLTLVQTRQLWTTGVLFLNAWECWARGLKVVKAGRYPVYSRYAKWCEIRDCDFDDAWYHGGGGTAYVGWEKSYDCLMENVTTRRMRHAPCVQWSASGNVIRKSTFIGSDMQWHAGWTNENLFEQCVVNAAGRTGSYGHGAWASPPNDTAHGPEGPRNVVYNCDIRGRRSGLWMGGMNEAWLILHNRFRVDAGPGIYARTCSFDHVIRGNVFVLARRDQPALHLATPDCVGVELLDNRVYGGNGKLVVGSARPLAAQGNTFAPYDAEAPRPSPRIPSIFDWQRRPDR